MSDDLEAVIRYRIERAVETLADADALADRSSWNACVNRMYYACFYAVSALLTKHGLASSKHSGVRSLFNKHFVKTATIPKELGQVFNDLFERRREGDYTDFVQFEGAQVEEWLARAKEFVCHIGSLVEASD